MTHRLFATALVCLSCLAEEPSKELVKEAKFGVFFGGQVQERQEIPFEVDPVKQQHGFRVDFNRPLTDSLRLEWQLTMPGPETRDKTGRPRRSRSTLVGRGIARAGQTRFEHAMHFKPGDPLGLWNIRVVAAERVLIDRPFTVYDAAVRARKVAAEDGGT